jgi:hypothetical protein
MKHALGIFMTIWAAGLFCTPARASTLFSIDLVTLSANPGDVGDAFDVVLTNAGPSSITVASFDFEVSVTDPDITLTGADFSTVADPYIFAGDSVDEDLSLPLNFTSGSTLDANDTYDIANAGVTLASGESLALGEVLFDVADPATPGPFTISFTGGLGEFGNNNLSDAYSNAINVDYATSGAITVNPLVTTPEPSAALPLAGVLLIGAFFIKRRRRIA